MGVVGAWKGQSLSEGASHILLLGGCQVGMGAQGCQIIRFFAFMRSFESPLFFLMGVPGI